jgi:hypothetical protein
MSRDYFQSNEDIEKSIKESETADTPVKAAINVNSPVLFEEETMTAQPFAVKATLNTDENDIQYQVHDFNILNSNYTHSTEGGSCRFTDANPPGQKMELEPDSAANIIAGTDDARDPSYYWFDTESNPPIFGCVMQLDEDQLGSISPSGETLNMRIKTNYTVSKKDRLGSFEIYNSICSRVDCPLIVTTAANQSEEYHFDTTCDGIDAGNGCSIVEPSYNGWEDVGGEENPILNRKPVGGTDDGSDTYVEQGEVAVELTHDGDTYYGGLDKNEFESLASQINDESISQSSGENDWTGEKIGIAHYTDDEGDQEMEIVDLDETEDGGCEYQSPYAGTVLLWKSCGFGTGVEPSGDQDRVGVWDVMRVMGPIVFAP